MEVYIEEIRNLSPTLQKYTFLNHASRGPLHHATAEAMKKYLECWQEFDFNPADEAMEESRKNFAKLINAQPEEIAFTADVTDGSRIVTLMQKYEKGDNIVCYGDDYVSQVYPALFISKKEKIEYRAVKPNKDNSIPVENFAEQIDENTKLVLLSHVQWLTGYKADIQEIAKLAHENDAFILVDTIQSTGALLTDVKRWNIDFLSCGTAKWLLGPSQSGFLYIRKELIDEFDPPIPGYYGVDYGSKEEPYWDPTKLEYVPTIDKFTAYHPKELMYLVANEGMKLILNYGIHKVEKRVLELATYIIEKAENAGFELITPKEEKSLSGIINIKIKNSLQIVKKLREKHKIITSSRRGGVRVSPHFYNTKEDIDRLFNVIEKL